MKLVIYEVQAWSTVPYKVDRCLSIILRGLCNKAEIIIEHVLLECVKGEG